MITCAADGGHIIHDFVGHILESAAQIGHITLISVSQITILAEPPGPQGAIGFDGGAEVSAHADSRHIVHDLRGDRQAFPVISAHGIGDAAVAKVPVMVCAPGPQGPVALDRCGHPCASGDSHHIVHDFNGNGGIRQGAVAQLPQAVVAPHPEGAVRFDGCGNIVETADSSHIVHHLFGGVDTEARSGLGVGDKTDAHLSPVVPAPAP